MTLIILTCATHAHCEAGAEWPRNNTRSKYEWLHTWHMLMNAKTVCSAYLPLKTQHVFQHIICKSFMTNLNSNSLQQKMLYVAVTFQIKATINKKYGTFVTGNRKHHQKWQHAEICLNWEKKKKWIEISSLGEVVFNEDKQASWEEDTQTACSQRQSCPCTCHEGIQGEWKYSSTHSYT